MARWKLAFCWWPRRLAVSEGANGMRFIGWVWLQTAYLTNNFNHGWVAFLDNQTPEYLERCPFCKRTLKEGNDDEQDCKRTLPDAQNAGSVL